jgi:hypothetical protein
MKSSEEQNFILLLDESYKWPAIYPFKFIVPSGEGKNLEQMMPKAEKVESRISAEGKYTAYTFHCAMGSGREVLDVYAKVKSIPGLFSL